MTRRAAAAPGLSSPWACRALGGLPALRHAACVGGVAGLIHLSTPHTAALAQASTETSTAQRPKPTTLYRLDPAHTFVTFEILHFDTATIRGRFGPLEGQAELNAESRSGRAQVVVDVAQVSTGLPVLDALLKRADLLDAAGHPKAYFVAESFPFDPQGRVSAVSGEFTLRGMSRTLTLRAQRWRCYLNPLFRREVCGGDFTAEFRRSEYGITHSLPFVSDLVRLLIQVEAVRASDP